MPARGQKRYRTGNGGISKRRKTTHQPSTNNRGYTRTSGYYGRYAPTGGELKFHDVDVDDAVIAQNGVIQNTGTINIIAQGTTESTRVGRKCVIKSILWKYNLGLVTSASLTIKDTVRMIVYLDRQCNGATAAASGITGILLTDDYQSFLNLANSGRFKILYDKTHALNIVGGGGNGTANDSAPYHINRTFYKSCNIPLEFNSTAGALTEIRSNNIGIVTFSKEGSVSVLDSKIRLRFSDG